MNCCFVVKAPLNAIMQCKQCQLRQNQFWQVLQNLLLCSHPWPNMKEQCTTWKTKNYAIMHWNQFCYIFFQFWEIWCQTRVSFFNSHCIYALQFIFPRICFKCLENKTLQLYSLGFILNYCHVDGWHLSFSHSLKVSLLHAQEFVHDGATVHLTRRCVEGVGIRPGLEINSLNNLFSFFAVEIINQRTGFHKHWFGRHFNLIWSS